MGAGKIKSVPVREIAERLGISDDTLRNRFGSASGAVGIDAAIEYVRAKTIPVGRITVEQSNRAAEYLSELLGRIEAEPITAAAEPTATPELTPAVKPEPKAESYLEFIVVNILSIGMTSYGLYKLYEIPGCILAAMIALFIWKIQMNARRPELGDVSYSALTKVALIEIASFLLHCITFWNALPVETQWAHGLAAMLPAAFVSYVSYSAVESTHSISETKRYI